MSSEKLFIRSIFNTWRTTYFRTGSLDGANITVKITYGGDLYRGYLGQHIGTLGGFSQWFLFSVILLPWIPPRIPTHIHLVIPSENPLRIQPKILLESVPVFHLRLFCASSRNAYRAYVPKEFLPRLYREFYQGFLQIHYTDYFLNSFQIFPRILPGTHSWIFP